jgi:hypothetical protein
MKERKMSTLSNLGILLRRVETNLLMLGIAFKLLSGLRTLRFLNALIFSLVFFYGRNDVINSIMLEIDEPYIKFTYLVITITKSNIFHGSLR